jgi:hypothetical protein
MRKLLYFVGLSITLLFIFLSGCSSGKEPVTSANDIPIAEMGEISIGSSAVGMFGLYDLMHDFDNLSAELHPERHGSIGESSLLEGMNIFTRQPFSDCIKLICVS